MRFIRIAAATLAILSATGCKDTDETSITHDPYEPKSVMQVEHPEWTRSATIYQINTRQFTPEGTFKAAEAELPRLKALGADILWLMPIHEIGEKNRKGTLGSPYAVKDYYSVNPEFGTLEDFKSFLAAAHAQGMHVIIDWVANHTAWDNALATEHPDWYERDWKGDFRPTPWWDWSDIIDLDYSKRDVREYMTKALVYWVKDVGIDGYRIDTAGFVPTDFWENVRAELDAIKPVFMLGEWEDRDLYRKAFDATYAWSWNKAVHDIAMGHADTGALFVYYSWNESAYPRDAYRMTYTSNHDQNAWEGTQFERFGPALSNAIVLSVVGEGMPLIYNGQEAGNEKRLEFFEKDPIKWREHWVGDLFKKLFALKHANTSLWNGAAGARMVSVVNSAPKQVLSFVRENEKDGVFALVNFSDQQQTISFDEGPHYGTYSDYFTGEAVRFDASSSVTLPAWGYKVYVAAQQ